MPSDRLLHELWQYSESNGDEYTFCLAGPRGDSARKLLNASARLLWTVWAGSFAEAMTQYYARQGWGPFRADPPDLEPYPAEWIEEQRTFFTASPPTDNEARL